MVGIMSAKPDATSVWRVPVSVEDIDETGRHFDLAPDEKTRAAIAEVIGVRALPRLSASLDVARHGSDGLRVSGEVTAAVGQTCVVSLEPMESEVREAVDLVFVPQHAADDSDAVMQLDSASIEPPETLQDGIVDLGAIATEFLLLGVDPYPRKPDAMFEAPLATEPSSKPFAALAALKKRSSEGKE